MRLFPVTLLTAPTAQFMLFVMRNTQIIGKRCACGQGISGLLTFKKLFILSAIDFPEPFPHTFLIPGPKYILLSSLNTIEVEYMSSGEQLDRENLLTERNLTLQTPPRIPIPSDLRTVHGESFPELALSGSRVHPRNDQPMASGSSSSLTRPGMRFWKPRLPY